MQASSLGGRLLLPQLPAAALPACLFFWWDLAGASLRAGIVLGGTLCSCARCLEVYKGDKATGSQLPYHRLFLDKSLSGMLHIAARGCTHSAASHGLLRCPAGISNIAILANPGLTMAGGGILAPTLPPLCLPTCRPAVLPHTCKAWLKHKLRYPPHCGKQNARCAILHTAPPSRATTLPR